MGRFSTVQMYMGELVRQANNGKEVPPVLVCYIGTIGKNVTGTGSISVQFHVHNTGTCNMLPAFTGSCLAVQI